MFSCGVNVLILNCEVQKCVKMNKEDTMLYPKNKKEIQFLLIFESCEVTHKVCFFFFFNNG